jgi:hypothetical protein
LWNVSVDLFNFNKLALYKKGFNFLVVFNILIITILLLFSYC